MTSKPESTTTLTNAPLQVRTIQTYRDSYETLTTVPAPNVQRPTLTATVVQRSTQLLVATVTEISTELELMVSTRSSTTTRTMTGSGEARTETVRNTRVPVETLTVSQTVAEVPTMTQVQTLTEVSTQSVTLTEVPSTAVQRMITVVHTHPTMTYVAETRPMTQLTARPETLN